MKRQRCTSNEVGTIDAGIELATLLRGGDVVGMEGPLGAGKTCLARGIATGLGVEPREVASPTFAILHEHEINASAGGSALRLYHVDAYRLGGIEDLHSIGWDELIADQHGIVVIEWASRVQDALPACCLQVGVSYAGEGRILEIESSEQVGGRFHGLWDAMGE